MPIPGVPTLEPVALPYMSPQEAGRAGASVAGMGEVGQESALSGLQLQAHMRKAQGAVDRAAASNQLDAEFAQLQDDLLKTTDSRSVEEVLQSHEENLNNISKNWSKSPDAVQIQMMADSLRPGMQHHATVRQIDLMGKEWEVQTDLQVKKLLPQYVQAVRSGDVDQQKAILATLNGSYDEAIHNGLKTPADKQLAMNAFSEASRKDLNEAAITSPNPAERQAAIAQLSGKNDTGVLDLTNMLPGEKNAMLVHAREVDQHLNNLAESQKMNVVLNNMSNVFSAPEYKNNFEAQETALSDGDFLKKIGAVAEDGSPDRVLAEKLSGEVERKRAYWKQEQDDHDEKSLEKYSPLIYEHKISLPQIEQLQGQLSARAVANLKTQYFQERTREREEWRMERSMSMAERQDKQREIADQSSQIAAQLALDIAGGKVYEPMDIITMQSLLPRDKNEILQAMKPGGSLTNIYVTNAMHQFVETIPSPSLQYEATKVLMDQVKTGNLQGSQITDAANKILEKSKETTGAAWIESAFHSLNRQAPPSAGRISPRTWDSANPTRNSFGFDRPVPRFNTPPEGFDTKVPGTGKDAGKWFWGNSQTHEVGPEVK